MSLTAARLRALNAVIDEGNFSAAARRLGMSQPAVSQAIQDLEKGFGVKLFERHGRHLVPTDLCLDLAPMADEIRRLEDDIVNRMQRGSRLQTGILRVGTGSLMPGMALIGKFQQRFPSIQVQVHYGMYSTIIDAVLAQRVDVAILPNVPADRRFFSKVCLTQDVVALVRLGHALAAAGRIGLAQLEHERLIFQHKGSATQKIVDRAFDKAGLNPRPALVLATGSEVYEAVASGLGVGFMWRYGTSRKDAVRRIPILEINAVYEERVFRRADLQNPIVDAFFDSFDFLTSL